jgi:hypothetical protein
MPLGASTAKTDGRFQNKRFAPGQTFSAGTDNVSLNYRSSSTGISLKPKADLGNGVNINALVGYANYLQSEETVAPNIGNSQVMHEYEGKDWFYGVGVGAKISNNLDLSLNYKKYEMYYDAEVLSASVRYIF